MKKTSLRAQKRKSTIWTGDIVSLTTIKVFVRRDMPCLCSIGSRSSSSTYRLAYGSRLLP